jgi:MFS family permease
MRQVPISAPVFKTKAQRYPLANVFALAFNAQFGFYLLTPLLTFVFFSTSSPLFSSSVAMTERSLFYGLCLSLISIGSLIANAVLPMVSDHYGRKPAWIISIGALLCVALLSFAGLILNNPTVFILGFFLHGLLDANKSIGLASVSDLSHSHDLINNMGMLQSMIALGACIGPVIGGFLAEKNLWFNIPYILPFLCALTIGLISLSIALRFSETHLAPGHAAPHCSVKFNIKIAALNYYQLIRQGTIFRLFMVLILSQLSWGTYYQFIGPFLKTTYNFSPTVLGFFMGSIALWLLLAASIGLRLLKYLFTDRQIILGSVISIASGTVLTLVASLTLPALNVQLLFWIFAIPIAMGDVILYSLLVSRLSQEVPITHRGKAMGLNLIIAMCVWSFTALFGGYLVSLNTLGAFYFMPAGIFILLILIHVLVPSKEEKNDTMLRCR